VLAALVALLAVGQAPLRFSAIPEEAAPEMERRFGPLAAYLEKALGQPVKFVPVPDYAATVERLASKELDLVYYGGFTFVQARRRTGNVVPLVQREEDAHFRTHFITRSGSSIRSLSDLKGRSFTFGSISSTSGHLMPRLYLQKAGIVPEKDLARLDYSGAHDRTAQWVASGRAEAGAINALVWEKLVEEKKVDPRELHVFYTTPDYFDYNISVRGDLDAGLVDRIKRALLALDYQNEAHRKILDLQRTRRFIETRAENYDGIAEAARTAKLIRE
jgi:phosphonate transport system substrate-binding protein